MSPTLPLPPPEPVYATLPDAYGMVSVEGKANEDAYVACLNERTESGVITKSDSEGSFSLEIAAQLHDSLTLWQIIGSDHGRFTSVSVPTEEQAPQK